MTQLAYAGIGSRRTPPDVLRQMTVLAAWLERRGWHLHSGGAAGADTAFAAGAARARTLHLPWPGYGNHAGPDCHAPSGDRYRSCVAIAEAVHPAWHRCKPGARKLHARNVSILLGRDLDSPVLAVVCWTDRGRVTGGTGMGLRIAAIRDIPVLNFGSMPPRAICEALEDIRARHHRPGAPACTTAPRTPQESGRPHLHSGRFAAGIATGPSPATSRSVPAGEFRKLREG